MKIPEPFNSWDEYFEARNAFYHSDEWRELRRQVIERSDGKCVYCGRKPTPYNPINIDHRIPLCKRWDLRNKLTNLQLTCSECNKIKGGKSHIRMKKMFEPKSKTKLTKKERRKRKLERQRQREEKLRAEQKRKNDSFFADYLK
jgi:5-methylcytosine-specific restriction endonuclease McrA